MHYPLQVPIPAPAHFSSANLVPCSPRLGHHTITYNDYSSSDRASRTHRRPEQHNRDLRESFDTSSSSRSQASSPYIGRDRDVERVRPAKADHKPALTARHPDRAANPRPHNLACRPHRPEHSPLRAPNYREISPARSRRSDLRPPDLYSRDTRANPRDRFRNHEAVLSAQYLDDAQPRSASRAFLENLGSTNIPPRSSNSRWKSRSRSSTTREQRPQRSGLHFKSPRANSELNSARTPHQSNQPYSFSPHQDCLVKRRAQQQVEGVDRSASPHESILQDQGFADNPNCIPLGRRPSPQLPASDLFLPVTSSPSQHQEPSLLHGKQQSESQDSFYQNSYSYGYGSRVHNQFHITPSRPPRSPLQESEHRDNRDRVDWQDNPTGSVTGANSTEVNMSARGNFRGSYGSQYPVRGHFNQGGNDQRNYSHSTSGSSFQGSPSAQSPYTGGRGSWAGQQQVSPQRRVPASNQE